MNKSELTALFSRDSGIPPGKSEKIVDTFFNTMWKSLAEGGRIEIRGFGSFGVRDCKGYVGINPKTGERFPVKERKLPFFRTGKMLAKRVNGET